MHVVLVLL